MDKKEELESVKFILNESKETYSRNLLNTEKIDSKIEKLFALILALIILFINTIKFPGGIFKYIYFGGLVSFIISLFLLIFSYRPKGYGALDPGKLISKFKRKEYVSLPNLLKVISGMFAENVNSIKDINKKKSKYIKISSYLILVGVICIVILKIGGA